MEELNPIYANFYKDKKEHYLKNIKKQNEQFCNLILSSMLDNKSDNVTVLPDALDSLNAAYINSLYEASESSATPVVNEVDSASEQIDEDIKQTILMIGQLCHQEIDEKALADIFVSQKLLLDYKDKIKAVFMENQELAEESAQYLDLIEQLRKEKRDMKHIITQTTQVLEEIYKKYQKTLDLPNDVSFKNIDNEGIAATFKLH